MNYSWGQILFRWALCLTTVSVLTFSTSHIAQAAPITFKFTGVVDSVFPAVNPVIAPNTPFSGSYTFDSTQNNTGDPDVGIYFIDKASLDIVGKHYSLAPPSGQVGRIDVFNDRPTDGYVMATFGFVNDPLPLFFDFQLRGDLSFQDVSLPLTPPSLGNLTLNVASLSFTLGLDPSGAGHLTSLTLAPVPVPGALLLFGSGLLGLAGAAVRRRMQRP